MKIAAFNVENLFDRAKVFNATQIVSNPINEDFVELNNLFENNIYSPADKARMIKLLKDLGMDKSDTGDYVILRKIRGALVKRPKNKPMEIIANGRADWVGWAELKTETVDEIAIINTGRVIKDVDADILCVVEAEDRITLKKFSEFVLKKIGGTPYDHIMLVDGNDERGIDVGVLTKKAFEILTVRSHIHDKDNNGRIIFSRDSPEYVIKTPLNNTLVVIPNHFKSKYGGNDPVSQAKRVLQATKVVEIYNRLLNDGFTNIVVLGDLNDTPDSDALQVIFTGTDLKDVSSHNSFDRGQINTNGTFGNGSDANKIDYLLLSPNLFGKVKQSGLFRKGAWAGKNPKKWEMYPEITSEVHVASDHHVIWAEINI